MTKKLLIVVSVLAWLGMLGMASAETESSAAAEAAEPVVAQQSQVPLTLTGTFNLGFRAVDVNGSQNKYNQHLNYKTGPRLFGLDLDIAPIGSGFFDLLTIRASNLGGDPFESTYVSLRNYEKFAFNYQRRKSTYFYNDTIIPEEPSGNKSNLGDFHTFNFDRTNDLFGFDFNIVPGAKVFANFNHQSRKGESTTSFDITRDEFELDKPLEEIKNDYVVGFHGEFDKVSFYFDETYRDYENHFRIFLPGASVGEDLEDAATLAFYEQLQPYDFTSPQSTFKLNFRPDNRWRITGSFIYSTLDGELGYSEESAGLDYRGNPYARFEAGEGKLDRTKKLTDIDVTYTVAQSFEIVGGLRFDRLDQLSDFVCVPGVDAEGLPYDDCAESGLDPGASTDTTVDISKDIFEIGARVFPNYKFTVGGGVRFEDREVTRSHEDLTETEPTQRASFFFNGVYGPSPRLNILAEYERDDYDDPFTLMSPTTLDRFKVRVRGRPSPNSMIVGTYLLRNATNDLSEATTDGQVLTIYGRYSLAEVMVWGDYSYQKVDTESVRVTLVPTFYDSKVNIFGGGLSVPVTDILTVGGDAKIYNNRGAFPLDWRMGRVFAEFHATAGYLLRLAYQYNEFDEKAQTLAQQLADSYDSNIFTMSIGYKF